MYLKNYNKDKKIILSLIEDDLIHSKLVVGLLKLGLNPEPYYLNLSETIFEILDLQNHSENELIFEQYVELSKKVELIDISISKSELQELADEIYQVLISKTGKVVAY